MDLSNQLIYQVFVRNHTAEGTIKALESDLKRIRDLGADILYLMPLQPIGRKGRKGSLGSPYAIEDYTKINPELGSWDDLKHLCEHAHHLGMKVMVDQVFNHTSRDSVLLKEHPEFYWRNEKGEFGNKVGDWSDVYDLDYSCPALTPYMIHVLDLFIDAGVDGFRFDVASLIPASFFEALHAHLLKTYPQKEILLLAECIEAAFALETRGKGAIATSNGELAHAGFQLFYCYASFPYLRDYLLSHNPLDLAAYRAACSLEEVGLPEQGAYIVRALENHDQTRLAFYGKNNALHHNLLAYSFFTRGPAFLYAGEEYGVRKHPTLFDEDKVCWDVEGKEETFAYVEHCIALKKREEISSILTTLFLDSKDDCFVCENTNKGYSEYGIFNFSSKSLPFPHHLIENGVYFEYLSQREIVVDKEHPLTITEPLWLTRVR